MRQLVMAVERCSYGMLVAHPWPSEFHAREWHTAFFVGLRKRKVDASLAPQLQMAAAMHGPAFDLRPAVDDFKFKVSQYTSMEEGMEVSVRHVRAADVPAYARAAMQR